MRADILVGGVIRVGDKVELVADTSADEP